MYRCGRHTSRLLWFGLGAFTASWYHAHNSLRAWRDTHCARDRIPQQAYPPPGVPASADGAPPTPQDATASQAQPGPSERRHGWGWGAWGRDHHHEGGRPGWGHGPREGPWGAPPPPPPPSLPIPGEKVHPNEKDIVQQATDTVRDVVRDDCAGARAD